MHDDAAEVEDGMSREVPKDEDFTDGMGNEMDARAATQGCSGGCGADGVCGLPAFPVVCP